MPFNNPARTDGAVFYHWRRLADEGKEYPFAKFNKVSGGLINYLTHTEIVQNLSNDSNVPIAYLLKLSNY